MGHKLGISTGLNNFHNVSLGQGQEVVAESAMEIAAKNGHWVVLQVNIRFVRFIDTVVKCAFENQVIVTMSSVN